MMYAKFHCVRELYLEQQLLHEHIVIVAVNSALLSMTIVKNVQALHFAKLRASAINLKGSRSRKATHR